MDELRGIRRVAYVTARYPPMRSSGTYRVEAVVEHLPSHGFELVPITIPNAWMAQQSGHDPGPVTDPRVIQPEGELDNVIRLISRIPGLRRVLREALVPDILVMWARSTTPKLLPLLDEVDAVYATGPPFSALILANELAASLDLPVIQEVRDPPSFNRRLVGRSRAWHKRMLRFERRTLLAADMIITVTDGTRRRLLELHSGLSPERCVVITNGYPEIEPDLGASGRQSDRFTVAYVGSFQGGTGSRKDSLFNPAIVLPALRDLEDASLRVVGPVTPEQRDLISAVEGGRLVTFTGLVERETALAEVAAADVALVIAEFEDWWIGRKVFEYLAFAKRILAIVPEAGDTAKLLKTHPKAVVVEPGAKLALRDALQRMYDDWVRGVPAPSDSWRPVQSDRSCVAEIAGVLHGIIDGRQASMRKA